MALLELIDKKLILSAHDVSNGGILVNLAEMCIAGNLGVKINSPRTLINLNQYFFSEDQSRYIVETQEKNIKQIFEILDKNSIFYEKIGTTQKERMSLNGEFSITVQELAKLNNSWFKEYIN